MRVLRHGISEAFTDCSACSMSVFETVGSETRLGGCGFVSSDISSIHSSLVGVYS